MTTYTSLAACCCTLLLVSLAAAVSPTPSPPTPEQRKAEIRDRMKSNVFFSDPIRGEETVNRMVALQDEIISNGGCNPNLCFAIDGSRLITDVDFERQIDFMAVIAATAGASLGFEDKIHIAAYQYGGRVHAFVRPTTNVEALFDAIDRKKFRRSRFSFLAPPMLVCRRDFVNAFAEDANKMVFIGDGRTNFRSPRVAIREAEKFLPPYNNGAICAITVKNPNVSFLNKVTQDPERVLNIKDTDLFLDLLEKVVRNVCDIF